MKTYPERLAETVRSAVLCSYEYPRVTDDQLAAIIASVPGESPGFVGTFTVVRGKSINQILYYETGLPDGDYKLYTSPQPNPDTRRKAIEECIAHAKSYLDYHAKATADYSGSCHAAMEYHINHARAASNCLDAMRSLLNKPEGETK